MRTSSPRLRTALPESAFGRATPEGPPDLPEVPPVPHSLLPAVITAGGTVCAVVYARLAQAGFGFVPECRWLRWTGIPCPGCGATRCLAACGRLDFAAAWQWHPLVAALVVAFIAWPLLLAAGRMLRLSWPDEAIETVQRACTKRWFTAVVIANWLYLCWALPR